MLRIATSGWVGVCIASAKVTVHFDAPAWSSPFSDGICGRLRRMRIAWPLASGTRLTSATIDPPLPRIGSISIGFSASNTSQTVSARRNKAAGVAAAKEKFRRRPSLSRWALTVSAAASLAATAGDGLASGDGSDAASFGGASAAGAGISVGAATAIDAGATGNGFGAASGLISILACLATFSEFGGAISAGGRDAAGCSAGFSAATGCAGTGAADFGATGAGAAGAGADANGAAGAAAATAGADEASATDGGSTAIFSGCWKATSMT